MTTNLSMSDAIVDFIKYNGLGSLIVLFVGWFLVARVFPWYTESYLPQHIQRQDYRDKLISELRDVVLELRALTVQMVTASQQNDKNIRDLFLALNTHQTAIFDLIQNHSDKAAIKSTLDNPSGDALENEPQELLFDEP